MLTERAILILFLLYTKLVSVSLEHLRLLNSTHAYVLLTEVHMSTSKLAAEILCSTRPGLLSLCCYTETTKRDNHHLVDGASRLNIIRTWNVVEMLTEFCVLPVVDSLARSWTNAKAY